MTKKSKKAGLAKLIAAANEGVANKGLLSQFELKAEEAKRQVGQSMIDKSLSELFPEEGGPQPCPICRKLVRVRKKLVPRTFKSLSGEHTFARNQHYCEYCKETFYPRDEELGLPKFGEASVELEQLIADWVLLLPPEEAAVHWNFHNRFCPLSANQFRQTAVRLGAMVEEADPHLLQTALSPPSEAPSATVYFLSDGSMLLLRAVLERELEAQLGAGWREMKLGMAFRQEDHAKGDLITRGALSKARYVGDFSQPKFKEQLKAAVEIECASGTEQVVYLADGAPENWLVADFIRPGAIQILDWYHAVENVMRFAKKLLGEDDRLELSLWKQTTEILLATGEIDELVRQLLETHEFCKGEQLRALDDIIRYVRNNQKRMDYPTYREMGLLIGSGPIESAQRHVIQLRMKRSGQRWSEKGARQMARLRTAVKTSGPERFYSAVRWAYRETSRNRQALNKVHASRKPPKRRASNR